MPGNSISYTGRVVNNNGQCKVSRSKQGKVVLEVLIAEDHREKNSRAAKVHQDPNKGPDDYVRTTTSWHRIRCFEELAEDLATDPGFNHGALVEVKNASYREEDPWETKDGVKRAGRPETIGDKGDLAIFESKGERFESDLQKALWDGESPLPATGGGGGGGGAREYAENEGF